jgi:ABC-type dipeptide/oligopeptide/nickel transport system ATPase subunit
VTIAMSGAGKVYAERGRVRAFGPVDLTLQEGESVALVGRSGTGKSTLARCLAGLEPLTEGRLDGGGRAVQLVFQDSPLALPRQWTVAAILAEPLELAGQRETPRQLAERLEQVGLPPALLSRTAATLSGGERQRVALARTLAVPELRLLLLDEPFAGLDPSAAEGLAALLAEWRRRRGLGLLLITHDLAGARRLADRVLVMADGRIVETKPMAEFFDYAAHPASRALLEAMLP